MIRLAIILYSIFIVFSPLFSQKHDNTWILGYPGNGIEYGHSVLTFTDGRLNIDTVMIPLLGYELPHNNSAYSTYDGHFFSTFNGVNIYDSDLTIMKNGNKMDEEIVKNYYYLSFLILPHGSQFIPYPNKKDSVFLLYASHKLLTSSDGAILGTASGDITASIISIGGGIGQVLERKIRIIENDTLMTGALKVCKHANGRDWWLLCFKRNSNHYYRVLIDPLGFHIKEMGEADLLIVNGANATCFSPDGTKFAIYSTISQTVGSYLNIFDFDRCTGILSNQIQIHDARGYGGLAFSPNSRYLYHNKQTVAHQYDLWAANIPASRKVIAIYDGFQDPLPATFYMLQLAPDGKIYSSATNGTRHLHVIHNPDEAGADCRYQQHGIQLLKYNSFSLPNFPNYRLGPLDGSACDTLGLDNEPKSWYRYEQDTLDALAVAFRDLSYYEPSTWSWDFGDGSPVNSARHPQHQYAQPGTYITCLTVTNQYGTDTHCKTLYLGVTAQDNPVLQAQIQVWPNPFRERFAVAVSSPLLGGSRGGLRLYDAAGRLVLEQRLVLGVNDIEVADLPAGLYVWEVVADGERVKNGKIVKMK